MDKIYTEDSETIKFNTERSKRYFGDNDVESGGTKEKDKVFPTAFVTAKCLAEYTKIPNAKELYRKFLEVSGLAEEIEKIGSVKMPFFLELRYLMSERILSKSLEQGEIKNIIELASGFTPHSVNLLTNHKEVGVYIENDFEVNLRPKQNSVNDFISGVPVVFIPGNVLDEKTWVKFEDQLDKNPVGIFCEGLMMYLSRDEQTKLFSNVRRILDKRGGYFMHEDILKYHPELKDNDIFNSITKQMKGISKSSSLDDSYTQDQVTEFYESQGFLVDRIDENEKMSIDDYPEDAKEGARQLQKSGFKMWKLSLPKRN